MSLFHSQTFKVRRYVGGNYVNGHWVSSADAPPKEWTLTGTAQPAPAARLQVLPEGTRLRDILDLYVDEELTPNDPDLGKQGDEIQVGPFWYVVITGDFFSGGLIAHGEYVIERKKEGTL